MWIISERICKKTAANGRFGASGALARPKVCADLQVLRPSERQWKPRLPQAAGTLCVSRGRLPLRQGSTNLNACDNEARPVKPLEQKKFNINKQYHEVKDNSINCIIISQFV